MSVNIKFDLNMVKIANYGQHVYGEPLIGRLLIMNEGDETLRDVKLKITAAAEKLLHPYERTLDLLPADSTLEIKDVKEVMLNSDYLAGLLDTMTTEIVITISDGDEDIYAQAYPLRVESPYFWMYSNPILLAMFSTPNHLVVAKLAKRASEIMEEWTGSDSRVGYGDGSDPDYALMTCAAIFQSIQECRIGYAYPPASHAERGGQRIRPAHEMLAEDAEAGTCIESSELYCSVAEAMGLHPGIEVESGHARAFVWLRPVTFSQPVVHDHNEVCKHLVRDMGNGKFGGGDLVVVECTMMNTANEAASFTDAVRSANRSLAVKPIEYVVDIVAARHAGIAPLPIHQDEKDGEFKVQDIKSGRSNKLAPEEMDNTQPDPGAPTVYTKQEQWERRLLSVDLRNPLLNTRFGKRGNIPLYCGSMTQLTDALQEGASFDLLSKDEVKDPPTNYEILDQYASNQEDDLSQLRLRSPLDGDAILKHTKELAKTGKTALEERGSNTLYMTVGMLRWYESPASKETPHYAPLLLYPVDLIPSGPRFKLSLRDEEVQLNATLMEMMKQEYKIELPVWETLPQRDKGGVDIQRVMASIRLAVQEQPRWDVLKNVSVGNYDFTDFALWRDIHENPEVLLNNKLVASLIAGHLVWEIDDARFEQNTPNDTMAMPVATDASQMFAIEAATGGETFVLNGPSGTGKTQCISGIVASSAGEGKTVLMVAEKQAAVDVAWKRLDAMGLGVFCPNLHSANTRKGAFLEQLGRILELAEAPQQEDRQYVTKTDKLVQVKKDLDNYAKALHTVAPCGMSLYELITAYEAVSQTDIDGFWLDPDAMPAVDTVDANSLARQKELLERMRTMAGVVGNPATHALRQVTSLEYSQKFKQNVSAAVSGYMQSLEQTETAAKNFARVHDLPAGDTYTELASFADLAAQMGQWSCLPKSWSGDAALALTVQPLQETASHYNKADSLRRQLMDNWHEAFLEMDSQQLIAEFNKAANSPALVSKLLLGKLSHRLERLQKRTVLPEDLGKHLMQLRHYQTCLSKAQLLQQQNETILQASFGQPPYDWQEIGKTITKAEISSARIRSLTQTGDDSFRVKFVGNEEGELSSRNMERAWADVMTKREKLYGMLGLTPTVSGTDWIELEKCRCQAMAEQIDMLKDWVNFNRLCQEVTDNDMQCVVEAYRAGIEPERVNAAYMKTMYQSLIGNMIDRDPTLNSFNGMIYNDQIESLRRLDKELVELTRKDIYNKVINRVRQVVATTKQESSELSALKKVIRSRGRGMTLRKIFRQHLPLIRKLCPCMMMSPASVAQYLPMENDQFDLVIFDEASQIPTARAVGALARGRNAVIVGDCNQMPPTTFFTSTSVDEDNLETEDLESVLDDSLALDVPSTYLKWHYRSLESIIAFSNNRFYDNKLLTFPSAKDRNSHVYLHYLKDGQYDGGATRRNVREAEAIIEYLRQHSVGKDRDMSVGIITLNVEQQRLVEDLLQKACREDEALRAWCDRSVEPMFIKNLENTQGDERDVILLSVNYGPDKSGKVSLNFGPLTKEGGWRRLNVAVTRARQKMEVFTSLLPEQIDLSRSKSRGVHELRLFLEYAGGRQLPVDRGTMRLMEAPSGIAENLCGRLQAAGYQTVRNVGCSDLRVDVAVIHPKHPEQYIMGILLDGGAYASAKTTRDREITQVDILRNLGWNIRRLWTLDWYDNREKEIRKLLHELKHLTSEEAAS